MSEFESQLRRALRRTDPPEGFADRVIARAATERSRQRSTRWRWALAAAATVVMAVAGLQQYRQYETQVRGERAKEQMVFALRIAGAEVHAAQQKVLRLSAAGEDR